MYQHSYIEDAERRNRAVRANFIPPPGICKVNAKGQVTEQCGALGAGFDMRQVDIQSPSDMKTQSKSNILDKKSLTGTCVLTDTATSLLPSKWTSSNTHSLIKNLAASAHLNGSFDSQLVALKASANVMAGQNTDKHSDIQAGGFNQYASSGKIQIASECYNNEKALNPKLLAAFKKLPMISDPTNTASWRDYKIFVETYGTHMQAAMNVGVRMDVFNTTTSTDESVAKELHIKSCLSAGPAMAALKGCASVDRTTKISDVAKKASEKRLLWGGDPELQRKLSALGKEISQADIDAFMASPPELHDGISYYMKPIWEVIASALTSSMWERKLGGTREGLQTASEDQQRIINLQTYVEGVSLCSTLNVGDWRVRELRATSPTTPDHTGYHCWNRKPGCKDSSACESYGVLRPSCKCTDAGGCVGIKEDAYENLYTDSMNGASMRSFQGPNASCQRPDGSMYGKCACNPDSTKAGADYYTWEI